MEHSLSKENGREPLKRLTKQNKEGRLTRRRPRTPPRKAPARDKLKPLLPKAPRSEAEDHNKYAATAT